MAAQSFSINVDGKKYKITADSPEAAERGFRKVQELREKETSPQGFAEKALDFGQGVAETGMTMASSMLAEPLAGWKGLYNLATGDLNKAAESVEKTQEEMTYEPRSRSGKAIVGAAGQLMEPVAKAADWTGEQAAEALGPAAGAAVRSGIEFIPNLIPGGGVARAAGNVKSGAKNLAKGEARKALEDLTAAAANANIFSAVSPDKLGRKDLVKKATKRFAESGIDLTEPVATQAKQFVLKAKNLSGNQVRYAERLKEIADAGRRLDQRYKEKGDELYTLASSKKAAIPQKAFLDFSDDITNYINEGRFALDAMPQLKAVLSNIKKQAEMPDAVPMGGPNGIVTLRRALGKRVKGEEGAAFGHIRARLDGLIRDAYDNQTMLGDRSVFPALIGADKFWANYRRLFDEEKAVRKILSNKEITPEEVRKSLFGESAQKYPAGAQRVMSRLKEIFGEDSPQIKALSTEVRYSVLQPLLEERDLSKFKENVDNLLLKNYSLATELLSQDDIKNLRSMRDWASAYDATKMGKEKISEALDRPAAILIANALGANNTLALSTLKQQALQKVLGLVGRGADVDRKRLLSEIAGVDLYSPMSDIKTVAAPAWLQEAYNIAEEEAKDKLLNEVSAKRRMEAFRGAFEKNAAVPSTRGMPGSQAPAAPAPAAPAAPAPGGAPNSQSRMMLEQLFPNDQLLQGLTPPAQAAVPPEEEQQPAA